MELTDKNIKEILKETDFCFDMSCEYCKDNRRRLTYFINQFVALIKFLKIEK